MCPCPSLPRRQPHPQRLLSLVHLDGGSPALTLHPLKATQPPEEQFSKPRAGTAAKSTVPSPRGSTHGRRTKHALQPGIVHTARLRSLAKLHIGVRACALAAVASGEAWPNHAGRICPIVVGRLPALGNLGWPSTLVRSTGGLMNGSSRCEDTGLSSVAGYGTRCGSRVCRQLRELPLPRGLQRAVAVPLVRRNTCADGSGDALMSRRQLSRSTVTGGLFARLRTALSLGGLLRIAYENTVPDGPRSGCDNTFICERSCLCSWPIYIYEQG